MNIIILSVIIPVYKTEATLEKCIASVLSQNLDSMEIILVDDGSPDCCPELCDMISNKNTCVSVIHKNNGGLSDARNAGLDIAKGKYVTFVDSDDYLLPETYPPLLKFLLKNPDVDILEFNFKRPNGEVLWPIPEYGFFNNAKDYWLATKAWQHTYAWNKIYKSDLYDKCRFPKGQIYEDLLLLPDLLKNCNTIATLSIKGAYIYTYNPNGISRQITAKNLSKALRAEIIAAWKMKTFPWNRDGMDLYRCMLCRMYDIIRVILGSISGLKSNSTGGISEMDYSRD